ncbi:MAG: DUF499 domain-containing protein [Acidobacteriota bacterium]|nr:DUF499 domain-containing protein [Acidobacteriota bacterium]
MAWKSWHEVVELRDDVKTGELSLQLFAADLYDVVMDKAKPVYQDPREFFSLTVPTPNMRGLAKDVVGRLAGKNDSAVRQLELTYGGGKTHALITLFHLTHEPRSLPDLPAVREFVEHIGFKPPKTRIAVLPFDKLDVQKGMETRSPDGSRRWLKHPWNVLAFQIAGPRGLETIGSDDNERDTPPAENLLTALLSIPAEDDLATLVLIDEFLMYAREKVYHDATWRAKLVDFSQYLTQASTKVGRSAIVASLLATDPTKSDELGKSVQKDLYEVFGRIAEKGVVPVEKEDVSEVIRRRFFTARSLVNKDAFRQLAIGAVEGIAKIDEQAQKNRRLLEDRVAASYPFHPDLTDVLHSKWTQLEGFQRTRGLLRTFALALRSAHSWDPSPLVATAAFLAAPDTPSQLSDATQQLVKIATTEEYEGRRHDWAAILEGELQKAREIQAEFPSLKCRELEQCVFATFLHSQPIGQKASTRELFDFVGTTRPDKIDLHKALLRWAQTSWFLDEEGLGIAAGATDDAGGAMPVFWRLGSKPNLKQMHHDACDGVSDEDMEAELLDQIGKEDNLVRGASAAGAVVHRLPTGPGEVGDDGKFHYVILGPKAASESGKPSSETIRYIAEHTGPNKPRTYRNSVVMVAPSRDGIYAAREAVRSYLGWQRVQSQFAGKAPDPARDQRLSRHVAESKRAVPAAIRQAYCIVVSIAKSGAPEAFKVSPSSEPLFTVIIDHKSARVQRTAVEPSALLPGGPYKLWHEGETTRWARDISSLFAQSPEYPRLLSDTTILETLGQGCKEGYFILRVKRPDGSVRTVWLESPDESLLRDQGLEVVLPGAGELFQIGAPMLAPGRVSTLWVNEELRIRDIYDYFSGGKTLTVQRAGYEEQIGVPQASKMVVDEAVTSAVSHGLLWLIVGNAGICGEDVPAGLISDDAALLAPPAKIGPLEVLPEALPGAWTGKVTSATAIALALSSKAGKPLPWRWVREALDGAFKAGYLERTSDSAAWPCDFGGANSIKVMAREGTPPREPEPQRPPGISVEADLDVAELQDLAARAPDLVRAAAGMGLRINVRVALGNAVGADRDPPDGAIDGVRTILNEISPKLKS